MKNKIENLYRQKLKLENDDSIKTVEYIKCLANINSGVRGTFRMQNFYAISE